jgi:hypothetical protein
MQAVNCQASFPKPDPGVIEGTLTPGKQPDEFTPESLNTAHGFRHVSQDAGQPSLSPSSCNANLRQARNRLETRNRMVLHRN